MAQEIRKDFKLIQFPTPQDIRVRRVMTHIESANPIIGVVPGVRALVIAYYFPDRRLNLLNLLEPPY